MSAGKGSTPRSCFSREYRENYDLIFPQRRSRNGCEATAGQANAEEEEEFHREMLGEALAKVGRALKSARTVAPHPLS